MTRTCDLRKREISGKSENFIESKLGAQSSFENGNFGKTSKKLLKKEIFSRSVLFHMKTRVYSKYFVHDCSAGDLAIKISK